MENNSITSKACPVNEHEASKMLGLAVQTLRNDRFLGKGVPYLKIGRAVRYRPEDIEAFLDAHRIDPGKNCA